MSKLFRASIFGALCSAAMLVCGISHATTLTFEGVGDECAINDFYNGGTDACNNSGTNYGIGFTSASLGLIDADAGGTGNFANEPSPSTALFFLSSDRATMNVAAGFDTGFSFYYSANADDTFVNVWSGLNGTGTLLATINLARNWNNDGCTGDPGGQYCHWDPIGVLFSGTAMSVDFGGTANYVAFDNVTLGSDIPGGVPEPGALGMFGLGLLLIGGVAWRKRRLAT